MYLKYEEIKAQAFEIAAGIAADYPDTEMVTPRETVLILVHHLGYQNIDFSGGLRSDPDDDTVLIQHRASMKTARPSVSQII